VVKGMPFVPCNAESSTASQVQAAKRIHEQSTIEKQGPAMMSASMRLSNVWSSTKHHTHRGALAGYSPPDTSLVSNSPEYRELQVSSQQPDSRARYIGLSIALRRLAWMLP
jgi:hypothetical protein